MKLFWVPGHCDLDGNEKADELARQGSGLIFCVSISTCVVRKIRNSGQFKLTLHSEPKDRGAGNPSNCLKNPIGIWQNIYSICPWTALGFWSQWWPDTASQNRTHIKPHLWSMLHWSKVGMSFSVWHRIMEKLITDQNQKW
jgi:hypothetical protein